MKKLVFVMALISLIAAATAARAQVYDPYANPYGYAPADAYPQVYDPYYQLHVIHYQLYLGGYNYYPYPYFVPVAPVVVAPPAVVAPLRQLFRATTVPVRRR